jgi:hypothetical protein
MSVTDDGATATLVSVPDTPQTPLTEAIVRHRRLFWIILAVVYLFAFNGQWRVGRDSALYRGLGHSLATGKGYTFSAFSSRQILPGYPVVLAGLEKAFGRSDLPPILLMQLMALLTLVFTYKLVRLRFPEWVAIIVAFAVGMNGWFLELSEEMLADLPFILGMMMALYGWERLRLATEAREPAARRRALPIAYLLIGLALCGVMRPTFWILAIAWVLTCIWGLIKGPHRRFFAICLGVLLIVWVAIALIDPRVRGFHPLAGGYERDALNAARDVESKVVKNFIGMVTAELAYGFFGAKWVPGVTELMNLIAIAACVVLWRRNPLWTLLVLLTIAVTLVMGAVPRYYAMVVPLMMLSWIVLAITIAQRLPSKHTDLILLAGILTVVLPNLAWCGKVIGQQRHWDNTDEGPKWADVMAMSEKVRQIVPQDQKVIAPGASIMGYLSGREVVASHDILPDPKKKSEVHWPEHLKALNIGYAVFPSSVYRKAERKLRELMDKNVIVPKERVAKVGELTLWEIEIQVPPAGQDWRKRTVTTAPVNARTTAVGTKRPPATQLARKQRHVSAEKKQLAQHKVQLLAKQARLARLEKQRKKQAAAKLAVKKRRARNEALRPKKPPTTIPTVPASQPAARFWFPSPQRGCYA